MRLLAISSICALLVTQGAAAQEIGFYGELFGGVTQPKTVVWDFGDDDPVDLKSDIGHHLGGALGVEVPIGVFHRGQGDELVYGLRFEGQLTKRQSEASDFEIGGENFEADGDVKSLAGMGNAYLDFGVGAPLTLSIGAGAGYARQNYDLTDVSEAESLQVVDDQDTAFAYQLMLGARVALNDMIGLSARYTYFKTDELVLTTDDEVGAEGFETDYASHDLSLGLVVRFVPDRL